MCFKRLDTQSNKITNKNSLKVPKVVKPKLRKRYTIQITNDKIKYIFQAQRDFLQKHFPGGILCDIAVC